MYRILVPLDGSLFSERAIAWADALAEALHADVKLVSAVDSSVSAGDADSIDDTGAAQPAVQVIDYEITAARAGLAFEAELFTRVRPTHLEVLAGAPGEAISRLAQSDGADLIIMSSHGRSDLQRAVMGSVADRVIRESRVPVLVIRDPAASRSIDLPSRILVPLDGSVLAEAILTHLRPLALACGSKLMLFWLADGSPPTSPIQAAGSGQSDMVEYLHHIAEGLNAAGIATDVRVEFGLAAESIARFAEQELIDLIAMSTHGRHGFSRWLHGSVTDQVLAHTAIPVLAICPGPLPARIRADVEGHRATSGGEAGFEPSLPDTAPA